MSAYVVQENEWLLKISQAHGFRSEQPLLDANPELAATYGDNPNILPPGLKLEIPDKRQKTEPAETEQRTLFVAVNSGSSLCLTFNDAKGNPLVGWTADITIGSKKWTSLKLDEKGRIVVTSIPMLGVGELQMSPPVDNDGKQQHPQAIALEIGGMDPVVEGEVGRKAVQKMLTNLGYYDGPINGNLGGDTRHALRAFEDSMSPDDAPEPDGLADEELCTQLITAGGNAMPPPVALE